MDLPVAIGIDVGGTGTKIALVSADGSVVEHATITTPRESEVSRFLAAVRQAVEGFLLASPVGIGVALPGFLAPDRRSIVYNPNTPALIGVDVVAALDMTLPVYVEQDLNAPALAEYHFGSGPSTRRFMAAVLGTGLGASVILDGEVLRFAGHTAGDNGHVILDPEGPRCTAGCRGCAEALIGTAAIEREAMEVRDDPRAAAWSWQPDGTVPARAVIAAARGGEPLALEIVYRIGSRTGQWLACIAPIFLPERIVLCGGVAEAGDVLLAGCRARFCELAGPEYARCTIGLSVFGGLAGVIGVTVPFFVEQQMKQ